MQLYSRVENFYKASMHRLFVHRLNEIFATLQHIQNAVRIEPLNKLILNILKFVFYLLENTFLVL